MYKVIEEEPEVFEFERAGKVYGVPALRCISGEELEGYYEAIEKGELESAKWMRTFFERHCHDGIEGLTLKQLASLYQAWLSGSSGEAEPGE